LAPADPSKTTIIRNGLWSYGRNMLHSILQCRPGTACPIAWW
jgi:hypothetical protein